MEAEFFGRLGKDAEVVTINGKQAMKLSVAETTRNADGTNGTRWYDCVSYISINYAPYLHKGDEVFVRGLHSWRVYKTASGETRIGEDVYVNKIKKCSSSKAEQQPQAETAQPTEDMPF